MKNTMSSLKKQVKKATNHNLGIAKKVGPYKMNGKQASVGKTKKSTLI